jgi:cell division protease FtsH
MGGLLDSDLGISTVQVASLFASYGMMGGDPSFLGAGPSLLSLMEADPRLREQVGRHMRLLERRAAHLIDANLDAVLAVATRLAEKRHLTGAEVEAIVVSDRPRSRRRRPTCAAPKP